MENKVETAILYREISKSLLLNLTHGGHARPLLWLQWGKGVFVKIWSHFVVPIVAQQPTSYVHLALEFREPLKSAVRDYRPSRDSLLQDGRQVSGTNWHPAHKV